MPSNPIASAFRAARAALSPARRAGGGESRRLEFFEGAPLPLASLGPGGRIEAVNRRFVRELGYDLADIPTIEAWKVLAHPDVAYREAAWAAWAAAFDSAAAAGRDVDPLEFLVRRKDGSFGTYQISASVVGESVVAGFIDVSERKRAEESLRASEARSRLILDNSPVLFVATDADDRIRAINRAALELLEVSEQQAIGADYLSSFVHPDDRAMVAEVMGSLAQSAGSTLSENRVISRSGREYLVEWRGCAVRGADGSLEYIVGSGIDITERVQASEALRAAEEDARGRELGLREQNERLLELLSRGPLLSGDFDAAIRSVTELAARLAKVRRASVWFYSEDDSALTCVDAYDAGSGSHDSGREIRSADFPAYTAAHRRGELVAIRSLAADPRVRGGSPAYAEAYGIRSLLDAPVRLGPDFRGVMSLESVGEEREWDPSDERLATMMATAVSLAFQAAENKKAREEAAKGEEALRAIVEAAPYSIVIQAKADGSYRYVNKAFLEANGLREDSALEGRGDRDFVRLEDPADRDRMAALMRQEGRIDGFEYRAYRKGELRRQVASGRSITYKGEDCYVSLVIDITDLKKAEDELKRLNAELERKVEERTQDLAHTNLELQALNSGLSKAMEELKAAQDTILVSEKLAALGRLVAGITHELSTPLAAIASSARLELKNLGEGLDELALAAARLGPEELALVRQARLRACAAAGALLADPVAERAARREAEARLREAGLADADAIAEDLVELGAADLASSGARLFAGPRGADLLALLRGALGSYRAARIAEDAVAKASRVLSALRTYARGGEDESPSSIALAPELRALLDLHHNRLKRGIEIALDIPSGLSVFGRREALGRIWFNLLDNAIRAAGEDGRIEILAREDGPAPGGQVSLSIADSGPGIPDAIKSRIFEPFFTTRPVGEGAGLGLDIARRLARENGGEISFESRPGRTVFTVRLPRGAG